MIFATCHIVLVLYVTGMLSWQRGRDGRDVVFTTTPIAWSGFNPQLGLIVASLDKMLHNDYLCLVASKKQ